MDGNPARRIRKYLQNQAVPTILLRTERGNAYKSTRPDSVGRFLWVSYVPLPNEIRLTPLRKDAQ